MRSATRRITAWSTAEPTDFRLDALVAVRMWFHNFFMQAGLSARSLVPASRRCLLKNRPTLACLAKIDSRSGRSMGGVLEKTYDLTSAYKQYGVHPSDRDLARIASRYLRANKCSPFRCSGQRRRFPSYFGCLTFAGSRGPSYGGRVLMMTSRFSLMHAH